MAKATKTTEQNRQGSAVDVDSTMATDSCENPASTFEIPLPSPPGRISFYRRLFGKWNDVKQPNTLHELVGSACQATCSLVLRRSKLSTGSNVLVTDPIVIDILLICISSVWENKQTLRLNLLPGCPISSLGIKEIINELPTLTTLALTSSEPATPSTDSTYSISSSSILPSPGDLLSTLKNNHQLLLKWLLASPFNVLASISPTLHLTLQFPSFTNMGVKCFLVTQQPGNKEALFKYHSLRHAPFPVFHGTHPSRLPLILSQGLKNMSGTRYQRNGKAMGRGIYLATDAATSFCYAPGAATWKSSTFCKDETGALSGDIGSVSMMLGCELAGVKKGRYTYVVKNADKVVVRFVFLIPGNYARAMGEEVDADLIKAMEALKELRGW